MNLTELKTELTKDESEVKAWFEKIFADIKSKLPAEHHAAVNATVSEASIAPPTPSVAPAVETTPPA